MANSDDKGDAPIRIAAGDDFSELVEALCALKNGSSALKKRWQEQALPSRQVIGEMIESLRSVLFPGYFGFSELKAESLRFHVGSTLDHIRRDLQEQIKRGLCFSCEEGPGCLPVCDAKARELTGEFLQDAAEGAAAPGPGCPRRLRRRPGGRKPRRGDLLLPGASWRSPITGWPTNSISSACRSSPG